MTVFNQDPGDDRFSRKNGLLFYEFPNLALLPGVRHAVFTRRGGASLPPFSSLNASMDVGDDPGLVEKNRMQISAHFDRGDLVFARQVHGPDVLVFKRADPGCPDPGTGVLEGDAMVTNIPGKILAVQAADCQPVLLFDPVRRVAAAVHSGWRGSLQNIIGLTLLRMKDDFGSRPSAIMAGIGPSLGPCCGEFIHYRNEIPDKYWQYKDERHHFDFWAISIDQLRTAGLPAENIHCSRICTACRTDLFFSYRKENVTGRFASVISISA